MSRWQLFAIWIAIWRDTLFCAALRTCNAIDFAKYPPPPEVIIYTPFRGLYNTPRVGEEMVMVQGFVLDYNTTTPQQTLNPMFSLFRRFKKFSRRRQRNPHTITNSKWFWQVGNPLSVQAFHQCLKFEAAMPLRGHSTSK